MLKNKDDFKSNEVVYKLLCGMEKAMKEKDAFSISIYLTKLKHHNITFEISDEHVVEDQPSQSQLQVGLYVSMIEVSVVQATIQPIQNHSPVPPSSLCGVTFQAI